MTGAPDPTAGQVLVTRAEPGATATAARLVKAGFTPVLCSVLRIETLPINARIFDGAQGVLLTSANAARQLADPALPPIARALPIAAVGAATAAAARKAGATDVCSADGDAAALTGLARSRFAPSGGPLVFLRGAEVASDLQATLSGYGFPVREAVAYAAEPVSAFPQEGAAALRAGAASAVLLHSARAAVVFGDLARASGLEAACARVLAVAISQRAASALAVRVAATRVAERPAEEAMLNALVRTSA